MKKNIIDSFDFVLTKTGKKSNQSSRTHAPHAWMIHVSSVHHCILTHGKLHGTATMILASFYSTIIIPMYSQNLFHSILFYSIQYIRINIFQLILSWHHTSLKISNCIIHSSSWNYTIFRFWEQWKGFNHSTISKYCVGKLCR